MWTQELILRCPRSELCLLLFQLMSTEICEIRRYSKATPANSVSNGLIAKQVAEAVSRKSLIYSGNSASSNECIEVLTTKRKDTFKFRHSVVAPMSTAKSKQLIDV